MMADLPEKVNRRLKKPTMEIPIYHFEIQGHFVVALNKTER